MIPNITVITPVYKAEKFIERSMRSLFGQTMTDGVEFVVVDDCSPDGSIEIVRRVAADFPHLGKQIKIIGHERNFGSAAARQTGLDNASGRWLVQIDSDDWCEPTMLERMYGAAESSGADILVCDFHVNFPSGGQHYSRQPVPADSREALGMLIDGRLHGSTCNKLVRRSLITWNGVRFVSGADMWEDLLFNIKLFYHARLIAGLPEAFVHYMQDNPGAMTARSSSRADKIRRDMMAVTGEIENFLAGHGLAGRYARETAYRKLHARSGILLSADRKRRKEAAAIYGDVPRRYALSTPRMSPHYRCALWLAQWRGTLWMANAIYRSVDAARKIVR